MVLRVTTKAKFIAAMKHVVRLIICITAVTVLFWIFVGYTYHRRGYASTKIQLDKPVYNATETRLNNERNISQNGQGNLSDTDDGTKQITNNGDLNAILPTTGNVEAPGDTVLKAIAVKQNTFSLGKQYEEESKETNVKPENVETFEQMDEDSKTQKSQNEDTNEQTEGKTKTETEKQHKNNAVKAENDSKITTQNSSNDSYVEQIEDETNAQKETSQIDDKVEQAEEDTKIMTEKQNESKVKQAEGDNQTTTQKSQNDNNAEDNNETKTTTQNLENENVYTAAHEDNESQPNAQQSQNDSNVIDDEESKTNNGESEDANVPKPANGDAVEADEVSKTSIVKPEESDDTVLGDEKMNESKNVYKIKNESNTENKLTESDSDNIQEKDEALSVNELDEDIVFKFIENAISDVTDRHYTLHKDKVNPIDNGFIINPTHICEKSPRYMTLLVLVPSLPGNLEARAAVRSTFGSYAKEPLVFENFTAYVKLAFLVGQDDNPESDINVRVESDAHGDIIYADFVETYRGLTQKVLIGIKWAALYCIGLHYYLKIDDDVFADIPQLCRGLHSLPYYPNGTIYGYLHRHSQVLREGKWKVSQEEYSGDWYPPYASGGSYVISGNIIKKMYVVAQHLKYFPMEDVFATGLVAQTLGAKHVHIPQLNRDYYTDFTACQFFHHGRMTLHGLSPQKLYLFWATMKNFHKVCQM